MKKSIIFINNTIQEERMNIERFRNHVTFFKENNIHFTFPENDTDIQYDSNKYEHFRSILSKKWNTQKDNFVDRLKFFFNADDTLQFTIHVTQYGPLGFYDPETNAISINLNCHLEPIDVIKHEMIHLMIEPFVQKYNLSHEQKERAVDTLENVFKISTINE
jgi:hypothetical protein